jgi:hypothetical protein
MAITFYQSPLGAPLASDGTFIARWGGRVEGKEFYESMRLKRFQKLYPNVVLRSVDHGMPENYRDGLTKELRRFARENKRTKKKT